MDKDDLFLIPNEFRHPLCFFRFVTRTISSRHLRSGHTYETAEEETPPNVLILECTVCGYKSVSWSWSSMEDEK